MIFFNSDGLREDALMWPTEGKSLWIQSCAFTVYYAFKNNMTMILWCCVKYSYITTPIAFDEIILYSRRIRYTQWHRTIHGFSMRFSSIKHRREKRPVQNTTSFGIFTPQICNRQPACFGFSTALRCINRKKDKPALCYYSKTNMSLRPHRALQYLKVSQSTIRWPFTREKYTTIALFSSWWFKL